MTKNGAGNKDKNYVSMFKQSMQGIKISEGVKRGAIIRIFTFYWPTATSQ